MATNGNANTEHEAGSPYCSAPRPFGSATSGLVLYRLSFLENDRSRILGEGAVRTSDRDYRLPPAIPNSCVCVYLCGFLIIFLLRSSPRSLFSIFRVFGYLAGVRFWVSGLCRRMCWAPKMFVVGLLVM